MANKTCIMCEKGKLKKKIVPYKVYGKELGKFPAEVCDKCGEIFFDEKTVEKIEKLEIQKGVFGLSKYSKIGYSGNSLIIRIPKGIAEHMNLKKEENILIHPEEPNKLVVEICS